MTKSIEFWRVWGKYYGYPRCCTEAMIKHHYQHPDELYGTFVGKRKHHGTGYIPCENCNTKTEIYLKEYISRHRLCKTPFPGANFKEDLTVILNSARFSDEEKALMKCQYKI